LFLGDNLCMVMFKTGFGVLDGFLGEVPREGEVTLFRGDGVRRVIYHFIASNAREGVVVDCSGSINPYSIGRAGERLGLYRERVLDVRIARAFTAHQVYGIVDNIRSLSFDVVFLLGPLQLFSDEEVGEREGPMVLGNCLMELKDVCREREGVLIIIESGCLGRYSGLFSSVVDEVVFMEDMEGGVRVRMDEGVLSFDPRLGRCQTTLDRYVCSEGVREFSFPLKSQRKLCDFMEVN